MGITRELIRHLLGFLLAVLVCNGVLASSRTPLPADNAEVVEAVEVE
jgi:hypothetical protein